MSKRSAIGVYVCISLNTYCKCQWPLYCPNLRLKFLNKRSQILYLKKSGEMIANYTSRPRPRACYAFWFTICRVFSLSASEKMSKHAMQIHCSYVCYSACCRTYVSGYRLFASCILQFLWPHLRRKYTKWTHVCDKLSINLSNYRPIYHNSNRLSI